MMILRPHDVGSCFIMLGQGCLVFAVSNTISLARSAKVNICCKVLWMGAQAVYNLYWHPLSKFPGPRVFAASRLPYVFASFRGRLAIRCLQMHDTYGPIVRTAPNEVSFIDPSAWKTIYDRKNRHKTPFDKNYDSFSETRSQIRNSMYLKPDEEHAKMRKVLSHAFSPEALRDHEPLLQRHVQELLQGLERDRKTRNGAVDLEKWFTWVAFDMIGDTCFGEPFNCVLESTHRRWPSMLSRVRRLIVVASGLKGIVSSLPMLQSLPQVPLLRRVFLRNAASGLAFNLDKVKSRINSGKTRSDVITSIVQHNREKRALEDDEVLANLSLFILAGTEIVPTLLCAVIYFLTQNPQAFKILKREIRTNSNQNNGLEVHNFTTMPYLSACIEEAMRLMPPVPEGLPRVTPSGGELICGNWIPGGVRNSAHYS